MCRIDSVRCAKNCAGLAHIAVVYPSAMTRGVRPLQPTSEQLEALNTIERASYRVADLLARPEMSFLSKAYNTVAMGSLLYACGGRRFKTFGLENLEGMDNKSSVLFASNHRSFFDFFSLTAMVYWHTKLTRRIFFPVRKNFFYDHPLGAPVNLVMSGMRMFPPIMREKEKKGFNAFSVARCIEELDRTDVGTVMGMHPEGTRGKGDDPYTFLPAQPGVGRIALGSRRAKVIPMFAIGMGQSIIGEMKMNAFAPKDHPVEIYFGAPIDFDDLRPKATMLTAQKKAADRCLEAIRDLAIEQRRNAWIRDGKDLASLPPMPPLPRKPDPVEIQATG